jgi:predicted RNA-binding protein with PUA-like domain
MKTEPDVFSFEDLVKAPKRTTHWEGVRNYQARNFMRDEFKPGQKVFIYHSNTEEPAIVGIAEVVRGGYTDDAALDSKSDYYDEKAAKKGVSPWVMVDVKAIARMKTPVTRALLAAEKKLSKMLVLQRGARLSIQPVTADEFDLVTRIGNPVAI